MFWMLPPQPCQVLEMVDYTADMSAEGRFIRRRRSVMASWRQANLVRGGGAGSAEEEEAEKAGGGPLGLPFSAGKDFSFIASLHA